MKRAVLVAVLVSVVIGNGLARISDAAIKDSKHDMSKVAGVTMPDSQTCIACHTPHNADVTTNDAPLWNHTNSSEAYTMYSSPTFDGDIAASPTGVSKLCMACHDGTVAVDAFGGMTHGNVKIGAIGTGSGNLGLNLKKSHPVSFDYNDALATTDGELAKPSETPLIQKWVKNGRFECSSCHDVHNNTGIAKMLNASNTGSALCITCHKK
ncbi:MAG: cytochrome C [Geobacter sp.]|nr:cytochrome C [Geobacter sp.]